MGKATPQTGLSGLECFSRDSNSDKCFLQPLSSHLVTLLYYCISVFLFSCISVLLYFCIFAKDPNCAECFLQPTSRHLVGGHPSLPAKRGRIGGGAECRQSSPDDFIFLKTEQNWSWMRPLLRCHLEIPKNCQISHGASFNRNLNRHLVEDRIPLQADRRS